MIRIARIGDLERRYVLEVLDSQFRSSRGSQMTGRLEPAFARRFGCAYAVAFVNGTATLHAALAAAGVGPGDEVIVPPLTMSSTAFAVLHCGAIPVFADIDPLTWTLDPVSVASRITPRTRAMIPVSIFGLSPDMDPLLDLCRQHKIFCLEDDAQCFLGYYKGRIVGSTGHASSFSFQSSKHMTCGEGGMIVAHDRELADRIRRFNSLGYAGVGAEKGKITKLDIQDPDYERHVSVGYNYRLGELGAAVALAQLERLDELVGARRHAAEVMAKAIAGCSWLTPQLVPKDYVHSCWTFAVRLHADKGILWRTFRDRFRSLGGDGIYATWKLTYLEPAFVGHRFGTTQAQNFGPRLCPVAESVQPWLLQFKTNYWDPEDAIRQAGILRQTIDSFE
jgi:perosamine synthetase